MTERTLIDASAWIEAMRPDGDEGTRREVTALLRTGSAVLCDFVRLELWNGARGTAEQRWLEQIERNLKTLPTSDTVWEQAREFARRCRRQGVTVPAADLLIAACAHHHQVGLLHRDGHFDVIENIAAED